MPDNVTLQRTGGIAHLAINRPETHNLITPGLVRDLELRCSEIADSDDIHCVVLHGAGSCFSAGWDLDTFAGEPPQTLAGDTFACVAELPQPVVAAIEGEATGGGLALALAADIRIAAEDATFALPEIKSGLIPLAGSVQRLVRVVGRGHGLALILTGEPINAEDARRMGLVSELVLPGHSIEKASQIAGLIAARGPIAVRYAKEAVARGLEMPLEQALRFETDLTILLQTTEDRAEGVRAFIEKRPPDFKGE